MSHYGKKRMDGAEAFPITHAASNPAGGVPYPPSAIRHPLSVIRFLTASLLLAALAACSSGSGGTDVTIGSGQSADPVTVDFPVFYVKRPVPAEDDEDALEDSVREPIRFSKGADLYMRDRASASVPEVNLTSEITQGNGDIRDVDVNFDGSKVIFSMRIIEDPDADPLPTWNIWEYDTKTKVLRRIITSDTTAEEGHDIMPHYLPEDGRIVFTSTRQRQSRAILLDENKPQYAAQVEGSGGDPNPAFVLHVMKDDGSDIHQITFNQSHDLFPSVLNDGRIVYSHWEQAFDRHDQYDLYAINPDGTGVELLYGANSHATGTADPDTGTPSVIQFLGPRAMLDGRTMALVRPFKTMNQGATPVVDGEGGDLVLIDTATYVDNTRGATPANAGMTGPAQTRALPTDVRTIPGPSPGGRYRSAAPLFDGTNRLLVSWSQCRLIENERIVPCTSDRLNNTVTPPVEAPPIYGIYIYDVRDNTQKPIVAPQEGFIYTEVVAGSGRVTPPVIFDLIPDSTLASESAGILDIRSVYDMDGADTAPGGLAATSNPANARYASRPARFLRIEKVVSQPDEDTRDIANTAFGPLGRGFGMRDILGYAPIEPDGSVRVKVPANVAFTISVLDARGRRLTGMLGSRHTNWLQVIPGETLECNGCHNPNATPPIAHGRRGLTDAVNQGATAVGAPFPNANPTLAPRNTGETMAQARAAVMCDKACEASVDIVFDDLWQPAYDPATAAGSFDMCYGTGASNVRNNPLDTTTTHICSPTGALKLPQTMPTTTACRTKWSGLCRITINYEAIIHPLWGADRFVDANNDGMNDVDGMNNPINHKCNTCHSPVNPVDATAQVPAADLDLTDGASEDEPDHFRSYEELLSGRTGQTLDDTGALVDECLEFVTDPDTNVTTCVRFRQVPASMSANGANASTRFFSKFDAGGGTVDHRGFLTSAELKLLAEWLDIGAQYYNDPFAAPED